MEELWKILIEYGGAIAVIGAVILLIRELRRFRNGKSDVGKQLENIRSNHLHTLQDSLDRIERKIDDLIQAIYSWKK